MTDGLDGAWFCVMVGVASVVMVVGTVGNCLTLLAIPYVRRHYHTEFSILQLPVTDLLINLSVCDLIYCAFGLPHMIHGMVAGRWQRSLTWLVIAFWTWTLLLSTRGMRRSERQIVLII